MKTLSVFFSFMALMSFSGCIPTAVTMTENDYYVQVFEDVIGSKSDLFLKSHNWMVEVFNDAESVVQHSDKEEGVIIGKFKMYGTTSSSMYGTADSRIYAIIDIRVKDNKARIEIKPQGRWNYDSSGMTIYNYSKQDAINDMKKLADDFHQALKKPGVEF
jgi:hypothetical protein